VLIGALVTAVIQSGSATSVIAISLVNAGALSNFVIYSRRLKDKLVNFAVLDAAELGIEKKELATESPKDKGTII